MKSSLLIAVGVLAIAGSFVWASQKNRDNLQLADKREPSRIFIGQSLQDACQALSDCKIEYGEGGFAFANVDPDQSNLIFSLDKDHTTVCVYFSKSKKVVTGIHMVFFPSKTARSKTTQSWVPATELQIHQDTSYSVHFAKPRD